MKKNATKQCALGEMILEFIAAEKAVNKLPAPPVQPKEKVSYTLAEWSQYRKECSEFSFKATRYKETKQALETRLQKSCEAIRNYIPKPHTWFVTEDKKFAVALQGSNWPGDQYRVRFRQYPVIEELPKLQLQIIN